MAWGIGELSLEYPKSGKLCIDGLFLSKAKNVPVRKFQRIMYHDTAGAYLLAGGGEGGGVSPQ